MTRTEQLQSQLPPKTCAVIQSDINRRYFSGMKSSAGVLMVFPEAAYLLVDFRYIEKAEATVKDCTVLKLTKKYTQMNELLSKHNAERVWVEAENITLAEYGSMRENISGIEISSSNELSSIITQLRMIKSDSEIGLMIKAQRIAEAALENTLNFIKEGVTEKEIALCLNDYMLRNGAEELSFETIALCGSNTSMPHGVPSDKPLRQGELVLMDFGAVYEGYHSDMTRTVSLGDPGEEAERVYSIVLEAQSRAIAAAKEGISCKRLDQVARDFIAANGYGEQFGHGLGHSVGMEIHEAPSANTRDDTVLRENTVMTVEPGIYLPKRFGVRIEDFVVIKQNSCFNLTNAPKNLIKL